MNHELTCRKCGETQTIFVSAESYQAWKNGEYIQNAMPQLSAYEREMFKTKTCSACFDKTPFSWI